MSFPVLKKSYPEPAKLAEYVKYAEVRQLADNINFFYLKNKDHPVSISMHSLDSHEGRTFLILSIGITLARFFSKKVLIVDTISDNKFLKTIEEGMGSDDKIIHRTMYDNLSIVHLSDLKVHEYQIDSILSSFEDEYDLVLFDTIALNRKNVNNIDPIAIAKRCEHRFVIVSKKSVSSSNLNKLKSEFDKSGLDITGIVFNEVEVK